MIIKSKNALYNNRKEEINDILIIIKLGTIVFSGIIFMKNAMGESQSIFENYHILIDFFVAAAYIGVLSGFYYLWAFIIVKKVTPKNAILFQIIENVLFTVFYMSLVLLTGKNLSQNKFLFMFIIITVTIQLGMTYGLILASISSVFIMTIDLVYGSIAPMNLFFENDFITSAVFFLTAWLLGYYVKLENQYILMLEGKANIDGLTGVFNHRYFYDELVKKIKSYNEGHSVALIFIDIDFFKEYNDLFGHMSGDNVLRAVGEMLNNIVKNNAIVARYGGDEFSIILTDVTEDEVYSISQKIRTSMEKMYFDGEEHLSSHNLTMSIGIAMCSNNINTETELIKCADDALYRAKFFKKNRVEVYSSVLDKLMLDIEKEHIDLITSIKTLISIINAKDRYTYGHVERVVMYAKLIANKLNLSETDKKNLVYGAYLHDIGKINIAEEILNKEMPLTAEEWVIMKEHPVNGANIIKQVPSLSKIVPLILYHHERYDGKGYPSNLKGEKIPYLARILTILDSFDAMTSKRPYKPAMTFTEASKELIENVGAQFDPEITQVFLEVVDEICYDADSYVPQKHAK